MSREVQMSAEDTAELQRLWSELPEAMAEASARLRAPHLEGRAVESLLEGGEKVDTIVRRICQLADPAAKETV